MKFTQFLTVKTIPDFLVAENFPVFRDSKSYEFYLF
jgi:hypothetical protein